MTRRSRHARPSGGDVACGIESRSARSSDGAQRVAGTRADRDSRVGASRRLRRREALGIGEPAAARDPDLRGRQPRRRARHDDLRSPGSRRATSTTPSPRCGCRACRRSSGGAADPSRRSNDLAASRRSPGARRRGAGRGRGAQRRDAVRAYRADRHALDAADTLARRRWRTSSTCRRSHEAAEGLSAADHRGGRRRRGAAVRRMAPVAAALDGSDVDIDTQQSTRSRGPSPLSKVRARRTGCLDCAASERGEHGASRRGVDGVDGVRAHRPARRRIAGLAHRPRNSACGRATRRSSRRSWPRGRYSHEWNVRRSSASGTMGRNLALNIEEHGFPRGRLEPRDGVDRRVPPRSSRRRSSPGRQTLEELVAALERPRRIMMMIPAGAPGRRDDRQAHAAARARATS